MSEQELRAKLHGIYSANFNDGEPVGERYGSKDTVHISAVIDFIDDFLVDFITQYATQCRIDELNKLDGTSNWDGKLLIQGGVYTILHERIAQLKKELEDE